MATMTRSMLAGLLVVLVLVAAAARARRVKRDAAALPTRFWISAMKVGGLVALLRVSILWYLTYREWTGTQSLSLLPLLLLLYPEGLLVAPTSSPTAADVWLLRGLLAVGSLVMTVVAALLTAAGSLLTSRKSG